MEHLLEVTARRSDFIAREDRERFVVESEERQAKLIDAIIERTEAAFDAEAPSGALVAMPVKSRSEMDKWYLGLRGKAEGAPRMALTPNAHAQIASALGIPKPYYDRMLQAGSFHDMDLLCDNINHWLRSDPGKVRLVRLLKPYTQEMGEMAEEEGAQAFVRAFLGAGYRTIGDLDQLNAVLPIAEKHGLFLRDYTLTDQQFMARFVGFEMSIEELREVVARKHGITPEQAARHYRLPDGTDVSWVNEVLGFGFWTRGSETGHAQIEAGGFLNVARCLNAYIVENTFARRHIGSRRKAENGFEVIESGATSELENALILSKLIDHVETLCDTEARMEQAATIANAQVERIEAPKDVPLWKVVEATGERYGLNVEERGKLVETWAEGRNGTPPTKWGLAQAFTRMAQDAEFERGVELEKAGWNVLKSTAPALVKAARKIMD